MRQGHGGQRRAAVISPNFLQVKLETRLPALFVDRLETVVPQLSGMDLSQLLRMAKGDEEWDSMKPLAEFESGDTDIIQLWLE